jgi:hypothetical protein
MVKNLCCLAYCLLRSGIASIYYDVPFMLAPTCGDDWIIDFFYQFLSWDTAKGESDFDICYKRMMHSWC